jgi:hypothetical protein
MSPFFIWVGRKVDEKRKNGEKLTDQSNKMDFTMSDSFHRGVCESEKKPGSVCESEKEKGLRVRELF